MTDAATQRESLRVAFQRLGHAAQQAAAGMAEAFAAAAQRLKLERCERAEARREAQWHRQQEKNILRQQFDRDTSYFGRKRRWRRARGRRIEARRKPPYVGGRIWLAGAGSQQQARSMLFLNDWLEQQVWSARVLDDRSAEEICGYGDDGLCS